MTKSIQIANVGGADSGRALANAPRIARRKGPFGCLFNDLSGECVALNL
jgi:hypothetical protein